MSDGFHRRDRWPPTGNPERVELGLRRWGDAVARLDPGEDRTFAEALPSAPAGRAMLECVFGASPFLSACAVRDPGFLRALWERGPGRCVDDALAGVRALPTDAAKEDAAKALRSARRGVAVAAGLADIASVWDLEAVTGALTRLAEESCSAVFRMLLAKLAERGALAPPDPRDPERGSGFIALGLGKLGGCELNYSSDIDLILLYDPDAVPAAMRHEAPAHWMRLARSFLSILSEPTVDGIAFRVDLRLRPDPISMPLVVPTTTALRYYGQRGQTWERAALIKARPVAGDLDAGAAFLAALEPFVWKEGLDFATVQDLHAIKKRIDAQHRGGAIGEPGQNLKLGRGGIREIEFFAQAHQLVWGGAEPALRTIGTCETLRAMTRAGRIPASVTEPLTAAYGYLRRVEHRIQMVADKQTHSLPKDPAELETLARFLGYRGNPEFADELAGHLRQVERQYESFFELPLEMTEASALSSLVGLPRDEAVERLGRLGFRDAGAALDAIESWRSAEGAGEAGDLLEALTPAVVIAACGTADPDLAVRRFSGYFAGLADGRQTLSLVQANLHVLETVAEIMVSAPAVGDLLSARPALLAELLDPVTDGAAPAQEDLAADLDLRLNRARDGADALGIVREWVDTMRCRTAVRVLFHSLDPLDAAPQLRSIADAATAAVVARAEAAAAARHGGIEGAELAVLAGGRIEPGEAVGDRLSLALCYDAPAGSVSDGSEPLAAAEYFGGLWSAVLRDLNGPPGERPTFAQVEGTPPLDADGLRRRLYESAAPPRTVRASPGFALPPAAERDAAKEGLAAAVCARGSATPPCGPWSVEGRSGGLLDVEALLHHTPPAAMDPADGEALLAARSLWTRILTLQRCIGGGAADGRVPDRLQPLFYEAADAAGFEQVEARMDAVAAAVVAVSDRVLADAGGPTRRAGSPS